MSLGYKTVLYKPFPAAINQGENKAIAGPFTKTRKTLPPGSIP
jgi:hypothetical protein